MEQQCIHWILTDFFSLNDAASNPALRIDHCWWLRVGILKVAFSARDALRGLQNKDNPRQIKEAVKALAFRALLQVGSCIFCSLLLIEVVNKQSRMGKLWPFQQQIPEGTICIAGSFRPEQVLRDWGGIMEILQPLPIHRWAPRPHFKLGLWLASYKQHEVTLYVSGFPNPLDAQPTWVK